MTQRVVGAKQTAFVGDRRQILVEHLLAVDDGTDLQEVEVAGNTFVTPIEIAGKLYLDRPLHGLRAVLLYHLQQLGQGEDTLLEHAAEGDDLAPTLVDAVADDLIDGVVGGGNVVERAVLVGLLHPQTLDVETVVDLEVVAHMTHVEGVEAGLRLS